MSKKVTSIDEAYNKARQADFEVKRKSGFAKYIEPYATTKEERMTQFREEARRKVSLANKRIRRLEEKGLTDTPAYRGLVRSGEPRFSVRGKDFNQLQAEVSRMDRFIRANTSTIRGANNTLKEMAKITKIKYKDMKDLQEKSNKFFELSDKIEQYLRTVHDMASAIGYQKIWESINVYIQESKVDLTDGEQAIDEMIENITKAIVEKESPVYVESNAAPDGSKSGGWFKLID